MGRLPSVASLRTTLAELRSAARILPDLPKLLPGASWGPARLVERAAAERPRAPALLHEDASYTWADVDARANQYARWFLGRGIGKRDVVALLMDNRPDFLFVQLGLAKLGAVAALINTSLTGKALGHAIAAGSPKLVVVGSEHAAAVASEQGAWEHGADVVVQLEPGAAATPLVSMNAEVDRQPSGHAGWSHLLSASDPTSYLFTSGTKGLPKGAVVTNQRYLAASAMFARVMHELVPGDVLYVTLPLYHSSAQWMGWGATMIAGATMALRRKFSASAFWGDVHRHQATHFLYIGELCRYLLGVPPSPAERGHRLRMAVGNGLRADVWERFQARFGVPLVREFYGATEGNALMVNLLGRPGMVGRLLPGQLVLRCDPVTGEALRGPAGRCEALERGTGLVVARINRFTRFDGYVDAQASKRKILRDVLRPGDAYFDTGDLMTLHEDRWMSFADRVGDTFRWKGENVSTNEVAEALAAVPGVLEANVYGVEVPGAEGRAGMASLRVGEAFDLAELAAFVRARLPAYQRLYFVRLSRDLAITGTFKHQKVDYRSQGYDPARSGDPLYYLDEKTSAYIRIDHELHERLRRAEIGPR
jgi:acyl-CoA synthetase (AMP-forming)/AMP-acid ligase II